MGWVGVVIGGVGVVRGWWWLGTSLLVKLNYWYGFNLLFINRFNY